MKKALLTILAASLLSPITARAAAAGHVFHRHHPAAARPRTLGARAAKFSLRFRGTPYVWAGTTPRGFDCSGFTRFVYAHMGIGLPHSSYAQWTMGRHVGRHALRPGDLLVAAYIWADQLGVSPSDRLRWAVIYATLSVATPTAVAGAASLQRLLEEGARAGMSAPDGAATNVG